MQHRHPLKKAHLNSSQYSFRCLVTSIYPLSTSLLANDSASTAVYTTQRLSKRRLLREKNAAMQIADRRFRELKASESRVRERCRELTERELVEPVHTEVYEITTWGLAYLRGDLDAEMLRRWRFK